MASYAALDAEPSDDNEVIVVPADDGDVYKRLLQNDRVSEGHNDGHCTYEEALKRTGNGRFHAILLLLSGWALCSDAVEVLCVSFLLPAAECDLDLTSQRKGVLNSVIFLGMMFGNYIWGTLADVQGRRRVLLYSLSLNAIANFCSSFSQVFWLFLLLRFVSGIGVGGSLPVVFSYFVEFQPKQRRGSMVSALATFWLAGNMLAPGLAWAIIPNITWGYFSPTFTYNSWRIFVAACSVPSLSAVIFFSFMPKSPKQLLTQGKEKEAIDVLKYVHKVNRSPGPYRVYKIIQRDDGKTDDDENENDDLLTTVGPRGCIHECGVTIKSNSKEFVASTKKLFKPPLLRTTIILLVINLTLAFGYYGLWMWFPELFKRMKESGGSACGQAPHNHTSHVNRTCDGGKDVAIYKEGFITAAANVPGNLLTICVIDYVGARILLAMSMVLSGVSVFFIWFVNSQTQGLIMSCIFSGISTIGWTALDVISVESFPTNVRSSAQGTQSAIARIAAIGGNLLFGVFVDSHCLIPMILVAVLLALGGLTAFKLPKLTGQDID